MRVLRPLLRAVDQRLTPGRVLNYPLLVLVIMVPLCAASVLGGHPPLNAAGEPITGDLAPPLMAARILTSGNPHRLYNLKYQFAVEQQVLGGYYSADPYISPPLGAYLYVPFTRLPYLASAALWVLLTLGLLVLSLRLLWPLLPNLHRYGFVRIFLLLLSTRFAFDLIIGGQDSAISLLIFVLGLRLLLARRDYLAGSVLALGLMKPQLVIVFPFVFLAQRRWKALGAWLAVASALTAASIAVLGIGGVASYIKLLTSSAYENGIALPLSYRMLSVLALVRSVTPTSIAWLVPVLLVLVLVPLAIGFSRLAIRRVDDSASVRLLYALTVLFTVLISPHFFVYDGVLLLLPALLLADQGMRRLETRVVLTLGYVLSWGLGWAHLSSSTVRWPMSIVAAPWIVAGILLLYWQAHAELALRLQRYATPHYLVRHTVEWGIGRLRASGTGRAKPAS